MFRLNEMLDVKGLLEIIAIVVTGLNEYRHEDRLQTLLAFVDGERRFVFAQEGDFLLQFDFEHLWQDLKRRKIISGRIIID